jgi:two-component system LytT family sensor kinase
MHKKHEELKSLHKQGEACLTNVTDFLKTFIANPISKIVRLEEELMFCRAYIEIQQLLFGNALTYEIDLSLDIIQDKFVPHFSIYTLLENAIRHNHFTEESPLKIIIVNEDNHLKVINNLHPKKSTESPTSQGLLNLAELYRLLSGDEIHILQSKNYFAVHIKLFNNEAYPFEDAYIY